MYSTRVHARIPNGYPREKNRAACRTSRRGSSCVSGSWTILARKSAWISVSVSVSAPWNASLTIRRVVVFSSRQPRRHGAPADRSRRRLAPRERQGLDAALLGCPLRLRAAGPCPARRRSGRRCAAPQARTRHARRPRVRPRTRQHRQRSSRPWRRRNAI